MTDPLALLPADQIGLRSGLTKWIKREDAAEAIELGWRPIVPNILEACGHDEWAMLCSPPVGRPMLLPGMTRTQRAIGWARFLLGRERRRG